LTPSLPRRVTGISEVYSFFHLLLTNIFFLNDSVYLPVFAIFFSSTKLSVDGWFGLRCLMPLSTIFQLLSWGVSFIASSVETCKFHLTFVSAQAVNPSSFTTFSTLSFLSCLDM
jgi:hypothetical protein